MSAKPIYLATVSNVKAQAQDQDLVHRRRQQIVDAAIKLFSSKGFESTTVGEIASTAGISTGLIYHYARTKEDVLLLALLSVLDSYRRELPPAMAGHSDPLERLIAGMRAYCDVIDRSMEATVLAYRATKSLPPVQRRQVKQAEVDTNALIEECIVASKAKGYLRDVDPALVTDHFVAFAHTWALKQWRLRGAVTRERYLREGLELLIRGIATPAGLRRYRLIARGQYGGA